MQHPPIRQCQISAEMRAVMNLAHRQVRQAAIGVRHQMQPRLPGIGKFQVDILKVISNQLSDFRAAVDVRDPFQINIERYIMTL
jgi:hypothetical protein